MALRPCRGSNPIKHISTQLQHNGCLVKQPHLQDVLKGGGDCDHHIGKLRRIFLQSLRQLQCPSPFMSTLHILYDHIRRQDVPVTWMHVVLSF